MTPLKLLSKHAEAGNVQTFVFETGPYQWIAGQSLAYDLPGAEEHWFTIASAPSEKVIHVSTRISGSAFKQALSQMQPGDTIKTHDLGGKFTWTEEGPAVVFVAAGIGITPFRSILVERDRVGLPLNARLIYFNRDEQIPFRALLEELAAKHAELKLDVVVGQPVTAEKILELAPEAREQTVYLSGPEPMVENVGDALKKQNVAVKQDWFPGYDEENY